MRLDMVAISLTAGVRDVKKLADPGLASASGDEQATRGDRATGLGRIRSFDLLSRQSVHASNRMNCCTTLTSIHYDLMLRLLEGSSTSANDGKNPRQLL